MKFSKWKFSENLSGKNCLFCTKKTLRFCLFWDGTSLCRSICLKLVGEKLDFFYKFIKVTVKVVKVERYSIECSFTEIDGNYGHFEHLFHRASVNIWCHFVHEKQYWVLWVIVCVLYFCIFYQKKAPTKLLKMFFHFTEKVNFVLKTFKFLYFSLKLFFHLFTIAEFIGETD